MYSFLTINAQNVEFLYQQKKMLKSQHVLTEWVLQKLKKQRTQKALINK